MAILLKSRGIAMIIVVLAIAILAPMVGNIVLKQQLLLKKVSMSEHYNTATMYALSLETWGRQILREDKKSNQHDGLDEIWAQTLLPFAVDGGQISGRIHDMQAKVNINNLLISERGSFRSSLIRLFEILEIDSGEEIIQATEDWLDADDEIRQPYGAEDISYIDKVPPYRVANKAMVDISELRLVRGITREIWQKLQPHLCALPKIDTKINVNTASKEVLRSLLPEDSWYAIDIFLSQRDGFSFKNKSDFLKVYKDSVGEELDIKTQDLLDVSSNFFIAETSAKFGIGDFRMKTKLRRYDDGTVKVMGRSLNNMD